jgi:hypothetical protein
MPSPRPVSTPLVYPAGTVLPDPFTAGANLSNMNHLKTARGVCLVVNLHHPLADYQQLRHIRHRLDITLHLRLLLLSFHTEHQVILKEKLRDLRIYRPLNLLL